MITVIMGSERYTIDQLVQMSGFSRRAIRYYVQEGLLDPPAGRGRGGFYNDSHVLRLQKIRSLRAQGISLNVIKRLLGSDSAAEILHVRETWARYQIAPGLEVCVRQDVEASSGRELSEIVSFATSVMKEGREDEQG